MQGWYLIGLPAVLAVAAIVWLLGERRASRRVAARAEAQAAASVESYRGLFESLVDAVVVEDSDGAIIDANPAADALFRGALFGRPADSLSILDEASGESFGLRDDGTVFPQEVRRNRVTYFGAPATLSLIRDITKRREAERAVRESEERYRIVAEQTGTIVFDHDLPSGEVKWSGAIHRITGWSEQDFASMDAARWADGIHPDDRDEALARIDEARRSGSALVCEYRFRHRSGEWIWLEHRGVVLRDEENEPRRMLGSLSDVTERKRITNAMAWQASHDPLTGLLNRHEFEDRVGRLLQDRRLRRRHNALLYFDLDQFKVVNDTCGHRAGDQLLRQITALLTTRIRDSDTLARLGGDEFGLLLEGCTLSDAELVAEGVIQLINEFRFRWDDKVFSIGASIGLVAITDEIDSVAALFSAADSACYAAKDSGRNRVVVYHPGDVDIAERRSQMTLVSRITSALEDDRFDLHFQRIEPLNGNGGCEHLEILMRMRTEDEGGLMPDVFIPAAERYNLMPALDRWAIARAFAELAPLFAAEPDLDAMIAINLSGTTLGSEKFTEYVRDQFRESGVPPRAICFEITETAAIANLHKARAFIDAMHALGCRIALDDFGSGLSSFAYLKALPVDYLKIDGAFIRDLRSDPVDQAMVAAIVKVGEAMGIRTIAEFVDTPEVLELLRRMGVDYVQGYAVHRPERWNAQRSTRSSTRLCTSPGL